MFSEKPKGILRVFVSGSVFRAFVPLFVLSCCPLSAINLNLTTADIDRALVIARERDADRARFHAPYLQMLGDPNVESLEVITQFRRVVLLAEEKMRLGNRAFGYSAREAGEAVKVWTNRVSVIARVRFHPLNNFVTVPPIEITIDGPRASDAFLGVRSDPILGFSSGAKNEQLPMLGAAAEASFDAAVIGQTMRTVTVAMNGKVLGKRVVDFASLE